MDLKQQAQAKCSGQYRFAITTENEKSPFRGSDDYNGVIAQAKFDAVVGGLQTQYARL